MNFQKADLKEYGFDGFVTISYLKARGCNMIPRDKGVYVVVKEDSRPADFLKVSIGGHFKDQDPTVEISELQTKWVDGASVVYIGKAGGIKSNATLFSRIGQFIKFGEGKKIGHWGGRYIWQLKDSDKLVLAWKSLSDKDPETEETNLIAEFRNQYGKRPFANLLK
jgi:hypothetical protein